MTENQINKLTYDIIGASIEVHKSLGPGLLEHAYRKALMAEFQLRGIEAKEEVPISIIYKNIQIDNAYRIDILVEDEIVLELKSTLDFNPLFAKQLRTYLRFMKKRIGLLLNFNQESMLDGVTRVINSI